MSNEDSRAHKLFDELLAEEAGTATPAPAALPVLPRMRLSPPTGAAPMSVKRKAGPPVPLPPAADLLPSDAPDYFRG